MQDQNMPAAPRPAPGPASIIEPTPDPVTPVSPQGNSVAPTGATPQKSHTGLIVAIVAAVIAVIIICVVVFALITPNSQKTDDGKKENETSKEEEKVLSFDTDNKTVTFSSKYAATIKSFIDAGFTANYTEAGKIEGEVTMVIIDTKDKLEKYTSKTIRNNETPYIHIINKNNDIIAEINGYDKDYDFTTEELENITIGDLDTQSINLQPATTYTFKGQNLDATTASIDEVKTVFGEPDGYDQESDIYYYDDIDGFQFEFYMDDKKIRFIRLTIVE